MQNKLIRKILFFHSSAAHCIPDSTDTFTVTGVRLGEYDQSTLQDCVGDDCNDPAFDIDKEEIIVHKKYSGAPKYYNDIALIRLAEEITYTEFIKPLCLPVDDALKNFNLAGKKLTAAGWGEKHAD